MIVLFDGDVLVYRAGYAVEARHYEVGGKEFKYVKEARAYAKDNEIEFDETPVQVAKSEEEAIKCIDMFINKVLDRLVATGYMAYLSSGMDQNDRYKLYPLYKQNRKGVRPVHYQALRDHLVNKRLAQVVTGIEADDALGIAQTDKLFGMTDCGRVDTIIASVDKDLLMIPGKHYNISTDEVTEATVSGKLKLFANKAGDKRLKGHGFKWMCAQMLLGDGVDNIPGINRCGPVKIYKLLNKAKTIGECWAVVEDAYKKAKRTNELRTISFLLWIQQKKYKTVYDFLDANEVEYERV